MGGARDECRVVNVYFIWHYSRAERTGTAAGHFAGMEKLCQR